MCYGHESPFSRDHLGRPRPPPLHAAALEDMRSRLAETESRLARARAREAELSRRLEEMKRFASVMGILENYLKRRVHEQQERVDLLFTALARKKRTSSER